MKDAKYKTYKVRLLPNKEQREQFERDFKGYNFVYNEVLKEKQRIYKEEHENMSQSEMSYYLTHTLKEQYPELKQCSSKALQGALFELWTQYQLFFENENYPFPTEKDDDSFVFYYDESGKSKTPNVDFKWGKDGEDNLVKLPIVSWVKFAGNRFITMGNLTKIEVKKNKNYYELSVAVRAGLVNPKKLSA